MAGRMHPPLHADKKLPAIVQPGTRRPTTRHAVLFTVNGTAIDDGYGNKGWSNPSVCSVLIDDHLPARSGYALPANFGIVYANGVTEWYSGSKDKNGHPIFNTVYGPWACDTTSMSGGSWVLADMVAHSVITVLQGTSNVAPTKESQSIGRHNHQGGNDTFGNPNAQPIGTLELQWTDTPGTGPVLSGGTPVFALTDVGHTTFDASVSFTVDMLRGTNTWLSKVLVYVVKAGSAAPTTHTKVHAELPPETSGSYTAVLKNIPFFRDTGWDVYVAYQDLAKFITAPTLLGTIAMPSLAAPIQTGSPTFTYTDAGNFTFDASFTTQLDTNVSQREVLFFLVRHGGSAPDINTTVHTRMPSVSSGTYAVKMKNLPANVTGGWDIYAAYKDLRHSMSTPTLIGTTASNPPVITATLPAMPSGIVSSGPTITAFSVVRSRTTGASQPMSVGFTETDFTSTVPTWLAAIELVIRTNGGTKVNHGRYIDPNNSTTGSYTELVLGLAGTPHDVGIRYVGVTGQKSAIVWPAGGTNIADPDGVMLSNTDGTMAYARHNSAMRTAVDSSGRVVGNIYDGTNSRTPANITTALDGSGRLIGNIYDGTNSRTPGNITTALDGSGRLIGNLWDGTNSRTPGDVTATVLSGGGIDFSSALHTHKDLDHIADGTTYARVKAADLTSGHVMKTGALGSFNVKGVGDSQTLSIDTEIVDGSTYARVKGTELTSGVVNRLNDNSGNTRGIAALVANMDSSGNSKLVEFSGVVIGTDGSMTGFTAAPGIASASAYSFASGSWLSVKSQFKLASTGNTVQLLIGSTTNGYGVAWNASDNTVRIAKWVAGTKTNLTTVATVTQDTNVHAFRLTVKAGASNTIEASFDSTVATVTDNALTLTTGTWPVTITDGAGGTTKFSHLDSEASVAHYTKLTAQEQAVVALTADSNGSYLQHSTVYDAHIGSVKLDTIADGTTYGRVKLTELTSGTVKQLNDGTNTRTAAQIAGAVDTSSRLIGSVYDGTTSLSPANLTNAITNTGLVKVANATGTLPRGNTDSSFTTAVDSSGRVIGSIYDGTNSRTPSDITGTVLSGGGIDFSSALHTNKDLDHIADGVAYVRLKVGGVAGGYASKTGGTGLYTIKGVGDANTLSLDSEIVDGSTYARVKASELASGTVKQLNDGTNVRTATQIAAAMDTSSNLLSNPFGSTSGVVFNNSDNSLSGFSSSGIGNATVTTYPFSQCILVSGDFLSGSSSGPIQVTVGSTTAGYAAKVTVSAGVLTLAVLRYVSGTPTTVTSATSAVSDLTAQVIRLRFAVDFGQNLVEALCDTYVSGTGQEVAYTGVVSDAANWPTLTTGTISVNAGGSTGKLQNFLVHHRDLWLGGSIAYQGAVNAPGSAHVLAAGIVDAQSLASGLYDNIPDGTTYAKVKAADLTSGHVQKTGATGSFTIKGVGDSHTLSLDSEIADGTTYKRVSANNIDSNGNLNCPFSNAQIYLQSDGSYHWPGSAQSTVAKFPIIASYTLFVSGWIIPGSTSNGVNLLIGDETNGLGIRWTSGGAVSLVTYKAGTATLGTSFVTVTRDSNYHWFSIKLSPGLSPGTSDAYTLTFDKSQSSGTTGTSAVTWSSTAAVTIDLSSAGGSLLMFHVGSNNP